MESQTGLSTLGEDEERSNIDIGAGIAIHNATSGQQEEILDELEELAPSVKTDANKFRMLCDGVQTSFGEIDNAMFELLELKDNLLLHFLPPNVSARITLVISRLYRAYSIAQVPVHELVRLVQLYSQPFDMKSLVLKKLYESNEMKKRMLNVALQRLTSIENNVRHDAQSKCINNWEKMYIRLALPRSNVRKWKFRLKIFRETAQLGYEHVVEWLNASVVRPASGTDMETKDEPIEGDDEFGEAEADRVDTSGDIVSVPEVDDQHAETAMGSDIGEEVESEDEGSFLSSAGKQKSRRQGGSATKNGTKQTQQAGGIVVKTDMEVQAMPELDDQQTWTGDLLSTKFLIMHVYRPVGILKAKFQCVVSAQKQKYQTSVFVFEKPAAATSKDENGKNKGRLAGGRTKPTAASVDPKGKKRTGDSSSPEDIDVNVINKEHNDRFLIPMPTVLKRQSLFQTDIDPDAIQIEVLADDKPLGSLTISPEDLRMLDLPNLNSPSSAIVTVVDDSTPVPQKASTANNPLELDGSSNEAYKSWLGRTPQTFSIYNDKREPIAKLPLQMFWYNKVEINQATKCTMTAPMETRAPTPKTVYVTQPLPPPKVETKENAVSPIVMTPTLVVDESTELGSSRLVMSDGRLEVMQAAYEETLSKLHDTYQTEIRRLTKLLSDAPSRRSSQMADLSEMDENVREILDEESRARDMPRIANARGKMRPQPKREMVIEHQPPPIYGKDLPKDFLDRYQMFLERSITHRHQLIAKVEQETARTAERQMEIQHRLHRPEQNEERYDDLCLPAVFMPFRSGNVFNPRAYQFFHHIGSSDPRLTQTPSIFKLPPLPSGSVSVLNLFELSRCYDAATGKERANEQNISQSSQPPAPPPPTTTQTSN